jgi:hypothetical protein
MMKSHSMENYRKESNRKNERKNKHTKLSFYFKRAMTFFLLFFFELNILCPCNFAVKSN